jgi:hypothetical protein
MNPGISILLIPSTSGILGGRMNGQSSGKFIILRLGITLEGG